MQYTFTPSEKGTHTRLADDVRGFLREYPDTVNVMSKHKVSDAEAYVVIREPEPQPEPEPVPTPASVEAGKVLGHLASFGVAESDLEDFIEANTPEGPERIKALNELKRRAHFEIDHPLVIAVAAAPPLNITTPEGIAQFFRDAQNYKYT